MSSVRNWYIYIVCAVSIQAVTWSAIGLMRNILVYDVDKFSAALQLAMIIIGLPVFLVHWLWGQRLARGSIEEQGGVLRRLYLYGAMAGFLGSLIHSLFNLLRYILSGGNDYNTYGYNIRLSGKDTIIYYAIAVIVLGGLWFYHQRVTSADARVTPDTGGSGVIRRLFVLGFSATGLFITSHAVIRLIRWIMQQIGGAAEIYSWERVMLTDEISRLLVSVALWIIFWLWAQRIFHGPSEEERDSALRKVYLYGVVFFTAIDVISQTSGLLASLIRLPFKMGGGSQGGISGPLPIMITMGILWAYHSMVLHQDAAQIRETRRQAGIRRLYYYLMAGVGLAALLVGLGGEFSVLFRSIGANFGNGLKVDFSWFTAAIIAGLPVWIIPWRKVQAEAVSSDPDKAVARDSIVRKVYLYFFLFIATMTLLTSAVYIVYRILRLLLGGSLAATELGIAISFGLIASSVLLYHGWIIRSDNRYARQQRTSVIQALRLVILDIGEDRIGNAVGVAIKHEFPELALDTIILPIKTEGTESSLPDMDAVGTQLSQADIIVAPWGIVVGSGDGSIVPLITQAVVSSHARKLLIPLSVAGWEWAGVDRWNFEAMLQHTIRALRQMVTGEQVKIHRPLGAGAIIGIVLGGLILLGIISAIATLVFNI